MYSTVGLELYNLPPKTLMARPVVSGAGSFILIDETTNRICGA